MTNAEKMIDAGKMAEFYHRESKSSSFGNDMLRGYEMNNLACYYEALYAKLHMIHMSER